MKSTTVALVALLLALPGLAAAQSKVLDRIRDTGSITLGYIADGAPFSFRGADGQAQGYTVDLCREVALGIRGQMKLARLDVRWIPLSIQERLEAVRTGRIDLDCSTTTWTLSRQAAVDFSLVTFVDGGSILAKAGGNTARLIDYDGRRVAVIAGTTTETSLREAMARRGVKARVVGVMSRGEGLELLDRGEVDGFASDRTTLIALVARREDRGAFRLLDEDFSVEPYALALPRDDHDFRLAVNRVLARLYRTGEVAGIYERWLGRLGPPSVLLSAAYFVQAIGD